MKLLLPPLALFLLVPPAREGVELAYAPAEGTVLERLFVAEASYRLTDMAASIDGEPVPHDGELPDYAMSFTERIAVTDTLESVAGGRPTVLLRHFDELRAQMRAAQVCEGEDTVQCPFQLTDVGLHTPGNRFQNIIRHLATGPFGF